MKRALILIVTSALFAWSCGEDIIEVDPGPGKEQGGEQGGKEENPNPETPPEPEEPKQVIPADLQELAKLYIDTPGGKAVTSRDVWVEFATIRIVGDGGVELYKDDSLKIRGRGNSTWNNYPKKPYYIKLDHQADFFGTGKSKRWVLLANWMDRTLLRNVVAFEAAKRTSMAWTPSGDFVELYLNGKHLGNYWLGEKINVEGSKFSADYLYSLDTSDPSETDFTDRNLYRANTRTYGVPVEVKYPDRDDYEGNTFSAVVSAAQKQLEAVDKAVSSGDLSLIDVDSFCDWYLVHELCYNLEPKHPKSCFFHFRAGKLYAGPIWDFDWATFTPDHSGLFLKECMWYKNLFSNKTFVARLKERWAELKPSFEGLIDFIDDKAEWIRSSEEVNHNMWPCYPNNLSEDGTRMVNHDEQLSFDGAVTRMQNSLTQRISSIDSAISRL